MNPYPIDKIKDEIDSSFNCVEANHAKVHVLRAISMMMFNKMLKDDEV